MNALAATGSAVTFRTRGIRGGGVEGKHPTAVRRSRRAWHRGCCTIFTALFTLLSCFAPSAAWPIMSAGST